MLVLTTGSLGRMCALWASMIFGEDHSPVSGTLKALPMGYQRRLSCLVADDVNTETWEKLFASSPQRKPHPDKCPFLSTSGWPPTLVPGACGSQPVVGTHVLQGTLSLPAMSRTLPTGGHSLPTPAHSFITHSGLAPQRP